jgi:arylsulfatase A-like enzyme
MTHRIHDFWNRPMNRRQALRTTGGLLAAGAAGLGLPLSASGRAKEPPNIIFILTDDHRWDALSILGHPVVETPNLDRLCGEGVRFENAFVTTSLCSPSRASFLTGQYAGTHGVKNNLTPWNNNNVTFLERLKSAGYDTSFIGKWHMPGGLPRLRGLDQFITFTVQGGQGRYFNCPLIVDGVETESRKAYITEELTDYALEFMTRKRNKPFCLYLSHKAVHHQFLPPPHIAGVYKDKELALPPEADTWISWNLDHLYCGLIGPLERTYRNYMEALHATDLEIGRVLARVDALGIADNTIIIYFGDNGFFFGEHRLMDKRWAYEESIRVPCIIRDPRQNTSAGKVAPQMVLNVDLAPTILEMAGLDPAKGMAGQSMVPYLQNPIKPGRDAWRYEYFQDFPYRIPEMEAVRTTRYKYIEYKGRKPRELFDLQTDPREQRNLMNTIEGRNLLPQLQKRLAELRREVGQ